MASDKPFSLVRLILTACATGFEVSLRLAGAAWRRIATARSVIGIVTKDSGHSHITTSIKQRQGAAGT